ncbi:MAG: hypothetical protein KDA41_11500, partial [Planctomycetales bacterium]|nr:hypothetical protein [Planctomycetales bacterium]
ESHERQFASGLVIVPPEAVKFVAAAQLDVQSLRPKWQVAMMEVAYEPSMAKAAARLNGTVDVFDRREAAVLPGNICVVKFGVKMVGLMAPAVRQEVARWLRQIDANETGKLSPYLDASIKFAEGGAPLIMAMDLNQAVSAAQVRAALNEMQCLEGSDVDRDQLAAALASVQGVSLGVTIGDRRFGKIKVDFAEDVSMTKEFAKPLLLEVLANRGMMINEFDAWTAGVTPHQITLEGFLYQSGTRRLLSMLDAPPELHEQAQAASQAGPDDPQQQARLAVAASQQYFKSIESLLDDLRLKRADAKFVTWNQVGSWFEKYARKIDRMPTLNVDPELLKFGAWVSSNLRNAESALKGITPNAKLRMTETPNYYDVQTYSVPIGVTQFGAYGWGGWSASENLSAKGQEYAHIRTQERIQGNMSANNTMQGVEQSLGEMRRYLTQKYQVEF